MAVSQKPPHVEFARLSNLLTMVGKMMSNSWYCWTERTGTYQKSYDFDELQGRTYQNLTRTLLNVPQTFGDRTQSRAERIGTQGRHSKHAANRATFFKTHGRVAQNVSERTGNISICGFTHLWYCWTERTGTYRYLANYLKMHGGTYQNWSRTYRNVPHNYTTCRNVGKNVSALSWNVPERTPKCKTNGRTYRNVSERLGTFKIIVRIRWVGGFWDTTIYIYISISISIYIYKYIHIPYMGPGPGLLPAPPTQRRARPGPM